jgi:uncharacterized caspase-like protein
MVKEKRIALAVGNANYKFATPLQNPLNDALKIAEALERLNFDVWTAEDCSINDFQIALPNFYERIEGADAALFYYSGHALQYDGENYLTSRRWVRLSHSMALQNTLHCKFFNSLF